jgi:hypothetical protein
MRTFDHGERERLFDVVALSHRSSGGKGSPATPAALAPATTATSF